MKMSNLQKGKLIILGTPIGNLEDFSLRGIQTLKDADFIAAEDTRVTAKLLNHFKIKKPMISYFAYSEQKKIKHIVKKISLENKICVLTSDAGMPTISDPGEMLVKACAQADIEVKVVPGASALIAALAVSGLPTGRFTFEGFLNRDKSKREKHLKSLENEERTMIFYEAPHKLLRTLNHLFSAFGDRKISICRELTKVYEEVIRTTLSQARKDYQTKKAIGEFVLVVSGRKNSEKEKETVSIEDAVFFAQNLMKDGSKINEAARCAAKRTGLKKSDIYKGILKKFFI